MKKHTQDQSFIEGKGFYIALCSCIAVLGIIAYAGHSAGRDKAKKQTADNIVMEEVSTPEPVRTAAPVYTASVVLPAKTPPPAPAVKAAPAAETVRPKESKTVETAANQAPTIPPAPPETPKFSSPAEGKIISTFSADLTYNKTMDDWRTHNGIDIQLEEGHDIKAAYDGVVREIGINALGAFITAEHAGGWQTIYANLDEDSIKLKKGDNINTGDIIGKLGNSTIEEKSSNSHLHFEILKNGENKNPTEYIK